MPQCFLLDITYSPKLCILILSVIPSSKHCVIVFSLWLVQYWYLMLPPPMDEWERDTKNLTSWCTYMVYIKSWLTRKKLFYSETGSQKFNPRLYLWSQKTRFKISVAQPARTLQENALPIPSAFSTCHVPIASQAVVVP